MKYKKIANDGKMFNELKTMTISEFVTLLLAYKKELGDIPIYHQRDPEGNGYGTIQPRSLEWYGGTAVGKALFIMPFNEGIEEYLFQE